MCDAIEHRGPDDSGYYVDENVSIGMRRLSIIDLAGGHQPMFNEDESIVLVFNGEIYNFRELRHELEEKGHIFSTNSDTEVIAHAYEEYGYACLNKFNGMFAIALWDIGKKELFLARDRLGIKPLYYSIFGNNLVFGSEIKSLVEFGIKPIVNEQALSSYFSLRYVPAPLSMFEGVLKLEPGHFLRFSEKGLQLKNYWNLNFTKSFIGRSGFKKEVILKLKDSVKKRLIADVQVGSFLSGGLDSSMITALANEMSTEPIKTFSVGFYGSEYDETPYSREVAEYFGTDHTEEWVDIDNSAIIPKLVYHLDEPLADPAVLPTYLISQVASKKVKVVLSGEGGDEAFAGYSHYQSELNMHYISRHIPENLKNMVYSTGNKVENHTIKKYLLYIGSRKDQKSSYYHRLKLRDNGFLNSHILTINDNDYSIDLFYNSDDYLTSMLNFDIKYWLPDDLLMKVDKMTMANSLEARVPFLDHTVLELTSTIPSNILLNKGLLKECAYEILPKEIIMRKKHGFDVPIKEWFKQDLLDEYFSEDSFEFTPYLNIDNIDMLLKKHKRGSGNYSILLWKCLSYIIWHNKFFK